MPEEECVNVDKGCENKVCLQRVQMKVWRISALTLRLVVTMKWMALPEALAE
ncbi:hypothetical protein ACTXT7_001901 [Hymenolepis weldensis]